FIATASTEISPLSLHDALPIFYEKHLDPSLPYLLRAPSHTLVTEAIAMLCGRLSRHRDFLVEIAGVDRDEAARAAGSAREELRRSEERRVGKEGRCGWAGEQ